MDGKFGGSGDAAQEAEARWLIADDANEVARVCLVERWRRCRIGREEGEPRT